MDSNPAKSLKPPRIPKEPKHFLQESDFQKLLDISPQNTLIGARRQAMLWVMLTTGIRRNEVQQLNLDDLDWEEGLVRIIHGKGQKQRLVIFAQEAQRAVFRYLQQRQDRLPCLWITDEGKPLSYNGIGQDLDRLRQRAGVAVKDGCHILRRTFAANAVKQKVPPPYVRAAMGHSSPNMLDLYTSWMETEYREAADAMRKIKPFGG